ncbi:hypothetical protein DAETH_11520 [Deinococcus aetherius]|uniref:HNH endonuclease n=1 Tax=Deinococcus aetherius TaxID=200252 RepID=A0ABN6RGK8_9DEIO|nr:hypothetical protein DAETH_11520 [Deinococcus aetherius]
MGKSASQKQALKHQVAWKSNGKCYYCGSVPDEYTGAGKDGIGGHLEHQDPYLPYEEYWSPRNLVLSCWTCNEEKGYGRLPGVRGPNVNLNSEQYLDLVRRRREDPNYLFYGMRLLALRRAMYEAESDSDVRSEIRSPWYKVELPEES